MDLDTARRLIPTYLERMRVAYQQPVFDEWAVLGIAAGAGSVLAYHGPRGEIFRRNVATDAQPLRTHTAGRQLTEGDIEFAPDAQGTRYDALVRLGATAYLVLNHTAKTMTEIRQDPRWLAAQPHLFELTEKFRADPLALDAE